MQTIIVKKCLMAFYFGLQVGVFAGDVLDQGACLQGGSSGRSGISFG